VIPAPVSRAIHLANSRHIAYDPGMTYGEPAKAPALRIGHKERDDAVELLRTAAGDGRITLDELEARVEAALEARTADDISVLIADLPEPTASAAPPPAAKPVRLAVSHGSVERLGAWQVPPEITIDLRHGVCALDLRTPQLPPGGVTIVVQVRHSAVKVLVPENAAVDLSNVGLHHSKTVDRHARRVTEVSGPPIVFVGDLHHGVIKILRPRPRRHQRRSLQSRQAQLPR
jgi:uncharacterized protein DUF1707